MALVVAKHEVMERNKLDMVGLSECYCAPNKLGMFSLSVHYRATNKLGMFSLSECYCAPNKLGMFSLLYIIVHQTNWVCLACLTSRLHHYSSSL